MFSTGEFLFLLAGTAILLGPKDLPVIARAIGRLTGKAVGTLHTMRDQFEKVTGASQANDANVTKNIKRTAFLSQVFKEVRDTWAQVGAVQHQVKSAMFWHHQGPMVKEVMENPGPRIQQATNIMHKIENTLERFSEPTNNGPHSQSSSRNSGHERSSSRGPGIEQSSSKNSVDLQCQATTYARFGQHLSTIGSAAATSALRNDQENIFAQSMSEIPVLDASAQSLGLFPTRTGPLVGGSDLVLETLAEEKVAQQALEFFEQLDDKSVTSTSEFPDHKQP